MKINRYFPLACALALMGLTTAETEARSDSPRTEPQAPYGSGTALDAPVESSFKYESFADARRLMEERTGLKAEANPDIAAFLEKLWRKRGEGELRTGKKKPAQQFRDAIC